MVIPTNKPNIFDTDDYSQFHFLPGNRDIHAKQLIQSIQERDMLSTHPILVSKRDMGGYYVLDGQHRLVAAKTLKKRIWYVVDNTIGEEHIPLLQRQRPWSLNDYLKYWSQTKEDYQFVKEICELYSLKPHFVCQFFSGQEERYKHFRNGTFNLSKTKEYFRSKIKMFIEISILCKNLTKKEIKSAAAYAIWQIISNKDYDHKRFVHKINTYPSKIVDALKFNSAGDIKTRLISEVYDYRQRIEETRTTKKKK